MPRRKKESKQPPLPTDYHQPHATRKNIPPAGLASQAPHACILRGQVVDLPRSHPKWPIA